MTTESLQCNRCGAPLSVAPTTNFVTCNRCGTPLAIKRLSGATYTEAAGGEALERVADQLAEITQQNELARIDREWQIEREQYMVSDRYGRRQVPSPTGSVIGGFVVVGFGIIWTIGAFAMTRGFPAGLGGGFANLFPLFGLIFILGGAGFSIYSYNKAQQYQQAYRAYQERRRSLLHGHPPKGPTAPPSDWPAPPSDPDSDQIRRG